MINSFANVKDLQKYIRNMLISQSELKPERVLNSLSTYGTELDKLLQDEVYNSIDEEEDTLLFELQSRSSTSDVSMTENENINYYKSFRIKVIIYGNSSSDIALKIASRFRTEEVRCDLYSNGIYLEQITDPTIINEYKNETMWLRNDLAIDISVRFIINPLLIDDEFSSLTSLNIINN